MKREQFALNLKEVMDNSESDSYDVAAAITREIHSVRNYLKGTQTPTVKVIVRLSNFLSVSPNALLKDCYLIKPEFNAELVASRISQNDKLTAMVNYFYDQSLLHDGSGIGKRIRILMEENSIILKDFAEAIHFSERSVKNILYKSTTSLPSVDNLIAICEYLNTSPHYLLQDELVRSDETEFEIKLKCLTPTQLKLINEVL